MNAVSALSLDLSEAKLAAAVAEASGWVRVATPIIKAMFALDDAQADLRSAKYDFRGKKRWNEPAAYDERAMKEADDIVDEARLRLFEMLDGIRDDFRCDALHSFGEPADGDDDAWGAHEALVEEFDRQLPTVDAVVKQVGDAM
jgi:hypothetical protein